MNKVIGKVLVKETGVGIPNLLVVVYDIDSPAANNTGPLSSSGSVFSGHTGGNDRLGSVLTDEEGRFELAYDDADFQGNAEEKRPDLTLLVLAPEDAALENQPAQPALQQRILYHSSIPRANAGRTESYVIRLLAAQLDKWSIPYPKTAQNGVQDKDVIIANLDKSFELEDAVREKLNVRIAKRLQKRKEAAKKAEKAFADFFPSSVPKELRKDPAYFAPGDDLKTSQKKIIKRDVERVRLSEKRRLIRISLKEDELTRLEMKVTADGTRTVSIKKLIEYMEDKNKGAGFIWTKSSLTPCKEHKEAHEIITNITGNHGPEEETESEAVTPDGNGLGELTAETLVKDMVARQMEHVTPAEAHLKYGIPERSEQGDITTAINALEIKGGPADVTAYHDFHNLQIAFEHIWKEEMDKFIGGWGRVIYEIWLDRAERLGITDGEADVVVQTREDLERMARDIRRMIEPVQEENQAQGRAIMYARKRPEHGVLGGLVPPPEDNGIISPPPPAVPVTDSELAFTRLQNLLLALAKRLAEPFKFDTFVPNSINYGILVTYRQEWKPLNFQVGDLVSTIPLAPKETRRYTKKKVVKKSRSQKEIEGSLRIVRRDSSDTKRADAEIVDRAVNKTNFKAAAEGSGKIGVVELSGSTGLEVDAEKSSVQTKKDFREAVLKAAEEYKQEHRLEIETTDNEESEETSSGEITNPNDELTVTYLLYELQRRYEVREKIHRLTPVILVANEVPRPDEIDEDWLIAHDWILKRVILDDSFLPALDFVSKSLVGTEFSLEVLHANMERQARVVEELQQQVAVKTKLTSRAFKKLQAAMEGQASALQRDVSEGVAEEISEWIWGEKPGEDSEVAKSRQENAKVAFEQFEREVKELQSRLSSEVTALDVATEKYTKTLEEHLNRKTEVSRLRIHVKNNIMYYMQAIWEHEPPDQRYFRLYNKKAVWLPVPEDVEVRVDDEGQVEVDFNDGNMNAFVLSEFTEKTLVEIADLDNLLGFKGNYMIFPLKQNNAVTWFMMQPYISDILGLQDPDEFANYTTDELIENFRCRYQGNPDAFTNKEIQEWRERILERLTAPRREKDIVIVPTDSLYIEALPGKHPLLEDFKLIHRALDVKKVQSEVRHGELENVRLGARLLSGEREDADIEKKIVIQGDDQEVIVPPDA